MALFHGNFYSKQLARSAEFILILPNDIPYIDEDNYHFKRDTKSLYMLHGYSGTNKDWLLGSSIQEVSSRYNLAVIMPSGENSFYLDQKGTGKAYCQYVGKELVEYVTKTFGLSDKKEDNFIGGLSMGGFGAIHTGLYFPETFGKIIALSSALIIHNIKNRKNDFQDGIADYDYYVSVFGDLNQLEYSTNNPEFLIRNLKSHGKAIPSIYMACGTEDFLIEENRAFHSFLLKENIEVTYIESPGVHDWKFWNQYLEQGIQWLFEKGVAIRRKQGLNPYLPSWEYIPDGEPYVFNDRVYVYGSHDRFNGHAYCLNDYICWSASVMDLSDWRYEGVIYDKTEDPLNKDGTMCLYAPDVTKGPDGRYYLYYVLDKVSIVSVAVCDTPAGKYEFYGYVHYQDGTRLGEREGDQPQFDPGVLTEEDRTYLYTGFCALGDKTRKGPMATVIGPDMLTILEEPVFIAPSEPFSTHSGFEGHEFFEAPSIRKIGDTYYFIYSSVAMHELCYASSKYPTKDFVYQGVIISNNDLHIATYKPANQPMYYGGNNHGSIVDVNGVWYIFYHRHTNGTNFSRQGCIEQIEISKDGKIAQVEMTSCGSNHGPLDGYGEYPAYLACNLFCKEEAMYTGAPGEWMDCRFPKITQDGKDGDEEIGYIANMRDSATAGFKYFDCREISKVRIKVRGYCKGAFEVKTTWDGTALGRIPVDFTNEWTEYSSDIVIPNGIHALYFTYTGQGGVSFASFTLE